MADEPDSSVPNSLVFGGSGFLGQAICKTLKRDGSQVIATYNQNKDCHLLSRHEIASIACDINDQRSVNNVVTKIKSNMPRLNSVIYAIGSFKHIVHEINDNEFYLLNETNEKMMNECYSINTQGVMKACQATIELLKRSGGGNIVLLGTLSGLKLIPSPVHLAAAKSALLGITQSLAKELGTHNIRINLVVPGMVNGPGLDFIPEKVKATYLKHSALRRFVDVQEVAEVVSWFALENSYVTGQSIVIDGGL